MIKIYILKMDKDRLLRYKEKLEYLKNTVSQLQDCNDS